MRKNTLHIPSLIPIFCGVLFAVAGLYIVIFDTPAPEYAIVAWAGLFNDALPLYVALAFGIAILNMAYVFLGTRQYDRGRATLYNVAGVALAVVIAISLGR